MEDLADARQLPKVAEAFSGDSEMQSPLFTLPAELRLQIYEHALMFHVATIVLLKEARAPGILQTCRKIYAEAVPIYQACRW